MSTQASVGEVEGEDVGVVVTGAGGRGASVDGGDVIPSGLGAAPGDATGGGRVGVGVGIPDIDRGSGEVVVQVASISVRAEASRVSTLRP